MLKHRADAASRLAYLSRATSTAITEVEDRWPLAALRMVGAPLD